MPELFPQQAEEGRLDRLIRGWGIATKREVRALVAEGRITVNGVPAREACMYCHPGTEIAIDGVVQRPKPFLTIMLNKPAGFVCLASDPRYPTIHDLLQGEYAERALFPVGRLDLDTEGLLLMTNDGKLSQRIARPEHAIAKTYLAVYNQPLCADAAERMREGIVLPNGVSYRPAELTPIDDRSAIIRVTEGKYHEVKRLIFACGARVTALKRLSIGALTLDPTLASGAYRTLTPEEIAAVFQ